jgi:Zn ribbon nucleic-acid-binding protein
MTLRPFSPDRRCPHCGSAASLYLEHVDGETDAVCVVCGYRRTGVIRRPSQGRDKKAIQGSLPIAARPL